MAARPGALSARSSRFSPSRGRDVREERKEWRSQKQEKEDEYLAWARENRRMAEATRARARRGLMKLLKAKQKAGRRERSNDYLVGEEKKRILADNRREVNAIFSARYASTKEVAKMWGGKHSSPTASSQSHQSPRLDKYAQLLARGGSAPTPRSRMAEAVQI